MTTEEQNQITEAFMKDFLDLLRKYDACFDSYYRTDIDFHVVYDEEGNMLRPHINLELPCYIDSRDEQQFKIG